ncbi:MAG: ABC transporter permease [Deltaproteobacteria bacterium CG07_land_8_20_14_0_80_38_7]|nr:MAG: ABC transporter permease [Deltaproteobacteria bacterium CG07_land_8_20_14_0_80_38_7]
MLNRFLSTTLPTVAPFGRYLINSTRALGEWCCFVWQVLVWSFRPPFRSLQFFQQLEFIGVRSTGIIVLTGFFSGAVFALQVGKVYALFNMESMVGATVALSLSREIAPVFATLMVIARACSSMAAEIGTMKVTEQVDALETMAVDPIQFLVVPRMWASVIMVPMLTVIYNVIGMIGAYLVGIYILSTNEGLLLSKLYYYLDADDFISGLMKAAVFGFFISIISCYQGFKTSNGAQGVGKRTTRAVVISSVTVLVLDYFLTSWIVEYFLK